MGMEQDGDHFSKTTNMIRGQIISSKLDKRSFASKNTLICSQFFWNFLPFRVAHYLNQNIPREVYTYTQKIFEGIKVVGVRLDLMLMYRSWERRERGCRYSLLSAPGIINTWSFFALMKASTCIIFFLAEIEKSDKITLKNAMPNFNPFW